MLWVWVSHLKSDRPSSLKQWPPSIVWSEWPRPPRHWVSKRVMEKLSLISLPNYFYTILLLSCSFFSFVMLACTFHATFLPCILSRRLPHFILLLLFLSFFSSFLHPFLPSFTPSFLPPSLPIHSFFHLIPSYLHCPLIFSPLFL